jgi:hypothetical protein
MAHESLFRDKQKFHSAPKKHTPLIPNLEQLNGYNVITINNIICLMIYSLKHRVQHLLV